MAPSVALAVYRDAPASRRRSGEHHHPSDRPDASRETPEGQWAMTIDLPICTGVRQRACVACCRPRTTSRPCVERGGPEQPRDALARASTRTLRRRPRRRRAVVTSPCSASTARRRRAQYVCPVNATTHSPDGLSEMIYNRCVRHAVLLEQLPVQGPPLQLVRLRRTLRAATRGLRSSSSNPDVTVRARGVDGKCTYCVSRIRGARDRRARWRRPRDRAGEVVTACQAGLSDQRDPVRRLSAPGRRAMVAWRKEPRAYAVLHE